MSLKDHEIAKLVNDLRDVAKEFHDHQSLRERIAHLVLPIARPAAGEQAGAVARTELQAACFRWLLENCISEDGNGWLRIGYSTARQGDGHKDWAHWLTVDVAGEMGMEVDDLAAPGAAIAAREQLTDAQIMEIADRTYDGCRVSAIVFGRAIETAIAAREQETFAETMRAIYGNEFPKHPNSAGEYPGWEEHWKIFQAGAALTQPTHPQAAMPATPSETEALARLNATLGLTNADATIAMANADVRIRRLMAEAIQPTTVQQAEKKES